MRIAIPTVALALIAGPALAICEDQASNIEYKDCVAKAALEAEAELESLMPHVFRATLERDFMSVELRQLWMSRLRAAQRAHEAFTEIDCAEVTGFEWWGGSGAGGAVSLCRYEKATARTRDLVRRYQLDAGLAPVATGPRPGGGQTPGSTGAGTGEQGAAQ